MIRLAALLMVALVCGASPAAGQCGISIRDWCASSPGDPCGRHPNERACRADPGCVGIKYRGESVVACLPDGRGFWTNCPAVGCVSAPAGGNPRR